MQQELPIIIPVPPASEQQHHHPPDNKQQQKRRHRPSASNNNNMHNMVAEEKKEKEEDCETGTAYETYEESVLRYQREYNAYFDHEHPLTFPSRYHVGLLTLLVLLTLTMAIPYWLFRNDSGCHLPLATCSSFSLLLMWALAAWYVIPIRFFRIKPARLNAFLQRYKESRRQWQIPALHQLHAQMLFLVLFASWIAYASFLLASSITFVRTDLAECRDEAAFSKNSTAASGREIRQLCRPCEMGSDKYGGRLSTLILVQITFSSILVFVLSQGLIVHWVRACCKCDQDCFDSAWADSKTSACKSCCRCLCCCCTLSSSRNQEYAAVAATAADEEEQQEQQEQHQTIAAAAGTS